MGGCKSNPEKSSTTKVDEHIPSGLSVSTILLFKDIESKPDVWRGKDCMKNVYELLREHEMEINNLRRNKWSN